MRILVVFRICRTLETFPHTFNGHQHWYWWYKHKIKYILFFDWFFIKFESDFHWKIYAFCSYIKCIPLYSSKYKGYPLAGRCIVAFGVRLWFGVGSGLVWGWFGVWTDPLRIPKGFLRNLEVLLRGPEDNPKDAQGFLKDPGGLRKGHWGFLEGS